MDNAFWIILIYFALSALGGLLSRQGKKAAERQRNRPASRPSEDPGGVRAETSPQPTRQTPEEIAAEIRRVMGLEREESQVEVIEEVYDEPIESATSYSFDPEPQSIEVERDHGGRLHDRLAVRAEATPGTLHSRQLGSGIPARGMENSAVGGLAARYARAPATAARGKRGYGGSAYIDISDMARALVTMEVLGPPKGLRDDWGMGV